MALSQVEISARLEQEDTELVALFRVVTVVADVFLEETTCCLVLFNEQPVNTTGN